MTPASLGVQTFDPALQAAIGREQPAELIERCTGWLRDAGITSLNFDLMYGLPGQTESALPRRSARLWDWGRTAWRCSAMPTSRT